ncbi:MAG: metal-dependent hydrolase [Syntrophobacteraceae bacterium]
MGVAFWAAYLAFRKPSCSRGEKAALLLVALVGTWIPDWDLLLGVGFHRSPLTHSILPVLLLGLAMKSLSRFVIPVGLAIGVSSHLFWDIMF